MEIKFILREFLSESLNDKLSLASINVDEIEELHFDATIDYDVYGEEYSGGGVDASISSVYNSYIVGCFGSILIEDSEMMGIIGSLSKSEYSRLDKLISGSDYDE